MAKLNQIIAVEKGVKSKIFSALSDLNKIVQKHDLFTGLSKKYQAKAEGGEVFPDENKRVQIKADEVLNSMARLQSEEIDITARKDYTNTIAHADVKIGDKVIIPKAPVSYILFLEKEMLKTQTLINNLPTLDEAESWKEDKALGFYVTDENKTHRTTKIQEPIVLYQATEHHPAQTQMITKDVISGYWTTIKQSGAMRKDDKEKLKGRVETLLKALKEAREAANNIDEVPTVKISDNIFNYLLGVKE